MRVWNTFFVAATMVFLAIAGTGCGGAAQTSGTPTEPVNEQAKEKTGAVSNDWVYGEWERCKGDNGANEWYVRRGTSNEGCEKSDDTWIFSKDGKWTHGSESGAFSIGPTQSSCELPEKSVGLAGTPGTVILIWESDNRVRMTTPCLM